MPELYERILEIFNYMRAEERVPAVNLLFIFGNGSQQQRLAEKTVQLCQRQIKFDPEVAVLCSGGIGRGSIRADIPEAELLRDQLAQDFKIPRERIFTETTSHNSGDNCRNGMQIIARECLSHDRIALVADAFAMRRMRAVFESEASLAGFTAQFFNCPTEHEPNIEASADRAELCAELLKVADWPYHDPKWSQEQNPSPPAELVAYARKYIASL